jgi:hypothetical protein
VAAALAVWVAGEDPGEILSGSATNPNTRPLLILIAAAFWPARDRLAAGSGGSVIVLTARRQTCGQAGRGARIRAKDDIMDDADGAGQAAPEPVRRVAVTGASTAGQRGVSLAAAAAALILGVQVIRQVRKK